MKLALAITAALASPALAEPCKPATGDVHVSLGARTEPKDLFGWFTSFSCKGVTFDSSALVNAGRVDISAPSCMSVDDANRLFLQALAELDLAVVPKGPNVRIAASDLAPEPKVPRKAVYIKKRATPSARLEFVPRVGCTQKPVTP